MTRTTVVACLFAVIFLGVSCFDPTIRDWTQKCNDMAIYAGDHYCKIFEMCCKHDELNGDKCKSTDRVCVYDALQKKPQEYTCILSNCTEMITTTTLAPTSTLRTKGTGRLLASVTSFFSMWLLLL